MVFILFFYFYGGLYGHGGSIQTKKIMQLYISIFYLFTHLHISLLSCVFYLPSSEVDTAHFFEIINVLNKELGGVFFYQIKQAKVTWHLHFRI